MTEVGKPPRSRKGNIGKQRGFDRFGTESPHCRAGTDGMTPRVPGLSRISPLRRIHGCCRRGDVWY